MNFLRTSAVVLAVLAAALPACSAEHAVLRNGFAVRHEGRTSVGDFTRLFLESSQRSFVDIHTSEIVGFEPAPDLPPAPAVSEEAPVPAAAAASPLVLPLNLDSIIEEASARFQLDPELVRSVILAESAFNPRAVSPKGARGLMQLMPQTAKRFGVTDSFDPRQNIFAGTQYLRELLDRYQFDLIRALAAYNAGEHRVEQYNGVPPYRETRAYVARIVREFNRKKNRQRQLSAAVADAAPLASFSGSR